MFKKIMIIILVVMAIGVAGAIIGGNEDSSQNNSDSQQNQNSSNNETVTPIPEETENVYFRDGDFVMLEEPTVESNSISSYIVGSVKNDSDKAKGYAQITISLYDEDGAVVGSAYDNISNIDAGGVWKFKALALEDFASWKVVEITGY